MSGESIKEAAASQPGVPRDVRFADVDAEKAYAAAQKICREIEKAVVGKKREVKLLVTALLAGSHVLIEDVPGVGKTTLAASLAAAAGLGFKRAQFTPDVTPSDITGFNIYNKSKEGFEFTEGLVMTNLLLADEINRASPKTQSALLEAMEEGKVTVDGKTYNIPDPFMVIATQNPSGFVGTYPLPESQLDRFGLRLTMGYPTVEEEMMILERDREGGAVSGVEAVAGAPLVGFLRSLICDVRMDNEVCRYLVTLVSATRTHSAVSLGAGPRASIALKRLCRAYAFMNGRSYVIPEDVYDIFGAAIEHRLILSREAAVKGITQRTVVDEVLRSVKVPYKGKR